MLRTEKLNWKNKTAFKFGHFMYLSTYLLYQRQLNQRRLLDS